MRSSPASTSRSLRGVVAGFQVSINGRFWVSTEGTNTLVFRDGRNVVALRRVRASEPLTIILRLATSYRSLAHGIFRAARCHVNRSENRSRRELSRQKVRPKKGEPSFTATPSPGGDTGSDPSSTSKLSPDSGTMSPWPPRSCQCSVLDRRAGRLHPAPDQVLHTHGG